MTDAEVRVALGAQSLHCLIVKRRLLLLAKIAQHGPSHLRTLLCCMPHGKPLPWVRLAQTDLRLLYS